MERTLADDIQALINVGHTLERATELAVEDRRLRQGKCRRFLCLFLQFTHPFFCFHAVAP
jgi:hypothetical protein